jgi:hypothetical protein
MSLPKVNLLPACRRLPLEARVLFFESEREEYVRRDQREEVGYQAVG